MAERTSLHASIGNAPSLMVLGRNTAMPMEAVLPHPRERADVESVEIEEYVADLHKKN